MQLGMVGLGRMGANLVRRLLLSEHECVVYDRDFDKIRQLVAEGARGATSVGELTARLSPPRAVWVMLPAGPDTEEACSALAEGSAAGDIIIDGGNGYFKDDIRRAQALGPRGIHYLDVGTSGGVWGLERGYCLTVGGPRAVVQQLDPIFRSLAPGRDQAPRTPGRASGGTAECGYVHCGPTGAGHFVKMIHNGIEYGLMQAYAEGFDILRNANRPELPPDSRYAFNLADIAEVWRRGSVVSSWLLDLTAMALAKSPDLDDYAGFVEDSGEGRWAVTAAVEEAVPAQVLSAALYARFRSRRSHTFAEKLLSAMRRSFGGHDEAEEKQR